MSVKDIYPNQGGDWLKANDLNNRTHQLIVETTETVMLDGEPKILLGFENREKKLLCNKTNARAIASDYGDDEHSWIGKTVTIFPTICLFNGDPNTPCIRVRTEEHMAGDEDEF